MAKRVVCGLLRGRLVRTLIGNRLQARRERLGVTIDGVAEELGIEPREYEAYEAGDQHAPSRVLTQIADLFGVPVFWLFQDVFAVDEKGEQPAENSPPVYYVATLEERLGFLADLFRKLDLEGQQQVLATAAALRQSDQKSTREDRCRDTREAKSAKPGLSGARRICSLQNPSRKFK